MEKLNCSSYKIKYQSHISLSHKHTHGLPVKETSPLEVKNEKGSIPVTFQDTT